MATTPTRRRGKSPSTTLLDTKRHHYHPELRHSKDTAQQPISPSSSAKQRKALFRIGTPPRKMVAMDTESNPSGPSASTSQQQLQRRWRQQQQQQGEEAAANEERDRDGDSADETRVQGPSSKAALETIEIGEDEEEESPVNESPFLVISPGMINIRRQGAGGGWYKESGLNCSTPTRPKHGGGANNWIGDLFSRGRLTRSRRTQDDELVELDHDNVAQGEVGDVDDDEGEGDEDDEDVEDVGDVEGTGRGSRSPVTPRSQFGRWKYSIMMSQSTMKPPKLSSDDRTAEEEEHGDDDGDQDEEDEVEDGKGEVIDTQWSFGNNHVELNPSTPKRRPSKIPRGRFMSPTSPTFRDSGCDDNEVELVDNEEGDDDDAGTDASNDDSRILDTFSSSHQEQRARRGKYGTGSSNNSSIWNGMMKSPKLNLRHLGGLPSSPSESSSASFHTPPRKRTRKDLDDGYGLRRPPPAPKLISPEQVLQFFPTNSQSPSVLKSLQLRRG